MTKVKESHVPPEQSQALKRLGFDWKCRDVWYIIDGGCFLLPEYGVTFRKQSHLPFSEETGYGIIFAPTLHVAARWLREVKNLHVQVMLNGVRTAYFVRVYEVVGNGLCIEHHGQFETFEDAWIAGIKKALDYLMSKQ